MNKKRVFFKKNQFLKLQNGKLYLLKNEKKKAVEKKEKIEKNGKESKTNPVSKICFF